MFTSPFSFDGRIRRTEFGISFIIYLVCYFLIALMNNQAVFILVIPVLWFLWAQGAKRCHDLGRSGWFQIIPFYVFWLIFQDGQRGENEYGPNPKGIGNDEDASDVINKIGENLQ